MDQSPLNPWFSIMIWVTVALAGVATAAGLGWSQEQRIKPVIVIDPGHGGSDLGAVGLEGFVEKDLTLTLARRIASEIGSVYQVVLTRNGDYGIELHERTAIANQAKADLFVSIHLGGSFRQQAAGMSVFYFDLDPASTPVPGAEKMNLPPSGPDPRWNETQGRHEARSRRLAGWLQRTLNSRDPSFGCDVAGAPLLVLCGADMPAVLVECGYVTHPPTEKMFRNPEWLSDLTHAMVSAIGSFLNEGGIQPINP